MTSMRCVNCMQQAAVEDGRLARHYLPEHRALFLPAVDGRREIVKFYPVCPYSGARIEVQS